MANNHGWNALPVLKCLFNVQEGWYIPLIQTNGHVLLLWPLEFRTMYARREQSKTHMRFMHPSATRRFYLLHCAQPNKPTGDTLETLLDIPLLCRVCQKYLAKPSTFSEQFLNEVVFNKLISVDPVYLHVVLVLHAVECRTNFPSVCFLLNLTTGTI